MKNKLSERDTKFLLAVFNIIDTVKIVGVICLLFLLIWLGAKMT